MAASVHDQPSTRLVDAYAQEATDLHLGLKGVAHAGGLSRGSLAQPEAVPRSLALPRLCGDRAPPGKADLIGEHGVGRLLGGPVHQLTDDMAFYPLEGHQIPALDVDDVAAHLAEERREVNGANDGTRGRVAPFLEPPEVVDVEVPGRLVEVARLHVIYGALGVGEMKAMLSLVRLA